MIANIAALTKALRHLNIPFSFVDTNKNVIRIGMIGKKDHVEISDLAKSNTNASIYFANAATPFNTEDVALICKDKEFTYRILKDVVNQPATRAYFDPTNKEFNEYRTISSFGDILKDVEAHFNYPFIIKRNSGFRSTNVFICKNSMEATQAIQSVFNKENKDYDFVLLAQEFIDSEKELRVVALNKKIELIYFWQNGKAVALPQGDLYTKIIDFTQPIFEKINLNWVGMDVILNKKNELCLIELNSKPGFKHFVINNGDEKIVELYKKALQFLSK